MKNRVDKYGREEGFTLIELLVVILIIGILSAIAVPAFLNQRKSAVDATVQSDIVNASTTVATWSVKNKGVVMPLPANNSQAAKDIIVTGDNKVTIRGNSDDYCIQGINPGGDTSADGIVYSSRQGGLNKTSPCDETFVPLSNPSINDTLVIKAPVQAGEENKPVATDPPATVVMNTITCEDVTLQSTEKTYITCVKKADSNGTQTNLLVTVGTNELTPIKWSTNVNLSQNKSFKDVQVDSAGITNGNLVFGQKSFVITGTDRSWNANPVDPVNYAYVTPTKTIAFTLRIQLK